MKVNQYRTAKITASLLYFSYSLSPKVYAEIPVITEVRGATNEGRYYIKGSGTMASLGVQFDL